MKQSFTLISSDIITRSEAIAFLQQAGGTVDLEDNDYLGYLEYKHMYVWIFMSDKTDELKEQLTKEQQWLGAPPRSFMSLEALMEDVTISYQLVYDFCYIVMQKYHCIIDTHMQELIEEDDPTSSTLVTAEMVKKVCEERMFSDEVPPLYERRH